MNLAGIDASLSGTGICVVTPERIYFYTCRGIKLGVRPSDVEKNQRLAKLVAEILSILKKHEVKIVAIENYAFSKSSSSVTPLAELQGGLKVGMFFAKILCVSLPVSTIRKFCIGRHIPKKAEFQREFKKAHHRLDTLPKNEDEWDAFAVAYTLDRGWRLNGDTDLHELISFHLSVPDESLA
jgi:Holliday junction resolvasome RuvABC endonuclease subunit